MGNPMTWAEIAERLGIPFAIVLLLFFFGGAGFLWLAKSVIKPVTQAHLRFVDRTGESQIQLVDINKKQTGHLEAMAEHDRRHDAQTMDRLEKIAGALERGCPLLSDQRKKEGG